jgi:hypothetical protein
LALRKQLILKASQLAFKDIMMNKVIGRASELQILTTSARAMLVSFGITKQNWFRWSSLPFLLCRTLLASTTLGE